MGFAISKSPKIFRIAALIILVVSGILLVSPAGRDWAGTQILRFQNNDENLISDKHNRLIHEKSPYLLQHASNPVDWYPWGEEAFQAARTQDKPVFLSIGYSTCHWCHVMEHESFEDDSVAALMNKAFINVKVDREERPDIDDIYMTVCTMMNGNGGWPLSIIMTAEKKPFFAATYIPKESRFNRLGMLELVPRVEKLWREDRDRILEDASKISEALMHATGSISGEFPGPATMDTAFQQLSDNFEPEFGGFSESPKFPTAHNLMFLMRQHRRAPESNALAMVETTLDNMRLGGIYDHVGFGFHRYSTDKHWLVPHFEKMLYDQAINVMAYTEAFQLTGKAEYRQTVEEVLTYVLRDMTDDAGGFYSAEDADSEGEEGKFYVWPTSEILEILGEEDGRLYIEIYNLTDDGNFLEESTRRKTGTNIPHLKKTIQEIAAEKGIPLTELSERLDVSRRKLFEAREDRIHPLKDDKILTDWNGLMIAAFCKAAQVFENKTYLEGATNAADFILDNMRDDQGRLMHRYREGEVGISAYLDDYAFFIWGLLELYETDFEVKYLEAALELNDILMKHFWDTENHGFFFTANDAEALLIRKKEIRDGAIPSGNSVAMLNLLRLSRMTGKTSYEDTAQQLVEAFSGNISRYPAGYTVLMMGLDFAAGSSFEIVVAGDPAAADTRAMLRALHQSFLPNKVLLFLPPGNPGPVADIAEYTATMQQLEDKATAYVCQNFACELPTTNLAKMRDLLGLEK